MPFVERDRDVCVGKPPIKILSLLFLWSTVAVESERPLCSQSFCKGKHALYYLATEESIQANCAAFREMAADFLQDELLRSAANAGWEMIFKTLLAQPSEEKLVIIIDEFQYLGKSRQSVSVCISENLGYPTKKRKRGSDSLRVTGSYDDGADPILFQPFIWAQNRAD